MDFNQYVTSLKQKQNLPTDNSADFLGQILDDQSLTDEQISEALRALTQKGESIDEILGFLDAMQARMITVDVGTEAIDTCGTGGDKSGTFNISTACALVIAADGVPVAKHGNRSASSKCGSADVLESLNIPIDNSPDLVIKSIEQNNFSFLFAQKYHPSLKRLGGIRKQLGFPTVFNILGPLLNPAKVERQVIGTFSAKNAERIAEIVAKRGTSHTLVIRSVDGLDEASLSDSTHIIEIKGDAVREYDISPDNFNLELASVAELQGDDATTNANIIRSALKRSNILSAHQRVIALNAGLGFYVSGTSDSIDIGVERAINLLQSNKPSELLKRLHSDG